MIKNLFIKGQSKIIQEHDEYEQKKVGCLRGGSVGMLDNFGNYAGTCPSQAYLRFHGVVSDPVSSSRELMFEGGRLNEDGWFNILKKAWDGPILREDELGLEWTTENGTKVTGRPDIVLCKDSDIEDSHRPIPVVGIELKQVMSLWTARDILFNKEPKTNHLMQACHYMSIMNVPFELWYTNRTDFAITGDWCKNLFPKYGTPGSEHCEYAYYRLGQINPRTGRPVKSKINKDEYELGLVRGDEVVADVLKVVPFIQGYQLEIRESNLWFRDAMVTDSSWVRTEINIDDIKRYYNSIASLETVPAEPINIKFDGTLGNYNLRDYCSLGNLCCAYNKGKNIQSWVDKVKLEVKDKNS